MTAYQGASHSDLALRDWQAFAGSPDADLLPELDTLTSRSRDLARNDGLMAGGLQTHRDNIVGAVLRLSALPDYRLLGWTREQAREWGNKVEAHFRSWADTTACDAASKLDLLGLTVLALGGEMVNGDAVAISKWLPRPDSPWATRLSLIESDRLQTPQYLEGRARIRRGVEFDRDGGSIFGVGLGSGICCCAVWPRATGCQGQVRQAGTRHWQVEGRSHHPAAGRCMHEQL